MIEPVHDPRKRLTFRERDEKRKALMQEVDAYIKETILYCDDELELIALGAMLQIMSKNILTSTIDRRTWKSVISKFAEDVDNEVDFASIRKMYRDYDI